MKLSAKPFSTGSGPARRCPARQAPAHRARPTRLHCSAQHPPTSPSPSSSSSLPSTRRHALAALLAGASLTLAAPRPARAEGDAPDLLAALDAPPVPTDLPTPAPTPTAPPTPPAPRLVYFDVTIGGEPAGRITVELFESEVPAGAARFAALATGQQGVDYRLSKFNGVLPTYIRNDGLNKLSYSASSVSPVAEADSTEELEDELDRQTRRHSEAGLVSLVVREREARPIKERLVAYGGKLVTVQEQAGEAPNGTKFTITTAPSPELDATALIIGRVAGGAELLGRIAALPVNRPRNDNPYFQAGKAMGDKRAVTAERAFYRPFTKVVVTASGVL